MALSSTEQQDRDRSEVPAQTVTNTGIGNLIGKCIISGQPVNIPQYTTLNELYNVLATQSFGENKDSRLFYLKYFGIGVRGSNCNGMDGRGISRMRANQHQPIDANLFTPIPFAARTLDNDFDNIKRAQYRMRVVMNFGGVDYAVYWLKLIDFSKYDPKLSKVTVDETTGLEDPRPFVPSKDDLFNPEPVTLTSQGTVPISNVYLHSSAILNCSLNGEDLVELKNACRIVMGDSSLAAISEVGIAYGIDVDTTGKIAGGEVPYKEVQSAVFAHYATERDARNANTNKTIPLAFDHGVSEPMLLHTSSTKSTL